LRHVIRGTEPSRNRGPRPRSNLPSQPPLHLTGRAAPAQHDLFYGRSAPAQQHLLGGGASSRPGVTAVTRDVCNPLSPSGNACEKKILETFFLTDEKRSLRTRTFHDLLSGSLPLDNSKKHWALDGLRPSAGKRIHHTSRANHQSLRLPSDGPGSAKAFS
jgi:hypothetical protein